MTKFYSPMVATLLMGSLALPAFAQGVSTPAAAPQKDASAITTPAAASPKHVPGKVAATAKPGVHKVAAAGEAPATVAKPAHGATAPTTATTAAPATDMKAGTPVVPGAVVPGKEAAKDGSVKTTAPVIKTN
jgi:hypothetical protein